MQNEQLIFNIDFLMDDHNYGVYLIELTTIYLTTKKIVVKI